MMRCAETVIAGLLLTVLVSVEGLAAPPAVSGKPAGETIRIDGNLDEACWGDGQWYSSFSLLDMPGKRPEAQTFFKIRFDAGSVYFAIRGEEPNTQALKKDAKTRDLKVWHDDCFEIMLDPTGERVEYYHIMVNPLGTVYDAQMRQGGNVRSVEWDCHLETGTAVGPESWSAEIRLPVVELGLNSSSVGPWALNVTRARRADTTELSTFCPLTGGFHQPSLFASLSMEGSDFGRFLWDIKTPYEATVLPDEDGILMYQAKVHIRNAGPRFRFFSFQGEIGGSAGPAVPGGLDSGQGRELAFRVPVRVSGKQTLVLTLADRKTGAPLSIRKLQVDVSYSPIRLDIRRPWYRNCIYATESLDAIEFTATVALPDEAMKRLKMEAKLWREGADGVSAKPVAARVLPGVQKTVNMSLPIGELAVADYVLEVQLRDRLEDTVAHTVRKGIRKLPPVEHEWRIDERNVLLHNGEPVLPFGWFSIPAKRMAEKNHAYQLMQYYNAQYKRTKADAWEWLDEVSEAGTFVTIYPYPSSRMMSPASVWGQPLSEEEAQALRKRVGDLKDHPAIFAWYMADEPELRPALPERCRRLYEICRDEDPYHPCIMLNDTIAGIFKYVDGGDVLMPDPYPCFIRGGLAAQPIEKTSKFVKACQEASGGRRAIWVTPQAFNYGDYGRKNQRGPNLTELRNQLYQAVVYGAKGFLWYTYSHTANYPDLDIGMRWLSFEVAALKEAILADPAPDVEVSVSADAPEHIHVSVRRVGSDLVIFAVNTSTSAQTAEVTLAGAGVRGLGKRGPLSVVSEDRRVSLGGGTVIRDRFGVYEAHVYSTSGDASARSPLADVLAEIAAADAARRRPGNLAFESSGAEVAVSSKSRYGSTPDRVVDGVRDGMQWRDGTAGKGPDWLTVTWAESKRVGRVAVFSPSISACEIQVGDGTTWRTVRTVQGNTGPSFDVSFPVTSCRAIRVWVTGLVSGHKHATIHEVEAYEK